MPDPQVPGYTQIANTTGAFGQPAQTPATQDQFTLVPSGASGQGVGTWHEFPFTHATPNLLTGALAEFTDGYTPAVGDLLVAAGFVITTAFDGTTPLGDLGTFTSGATVGMFGNIFEAVDMTQAAASVIDNSLLSQGTSMTFIDGWQQMNNVQGFYAVPAIPSVPQAQQDLAQKSGGTVWQALPAPFSAAVPLKVVVTRNGQAGGADPGSGVGAATLYVCTARF